jgi:heme/copper-type cytochrome/quinol oxidase subunit 4
LIDLILFIYIKERASVNSYIIIVVVVVVVTVVHCSIIVVFYKRH